MENLTITITKEYSGKYRFDIYKGTLEEIESGDLISLDSYQYEDINDAIYWAGRAAQDILRTEYADCNQSN